MNRLFATTAVLGLLAAPAWAQTMNSAPANSAPASSDSMAKPPMATPAPATHAATQGSGSSMRHVARSHHAKSGHDGDHSADKLNRQELQQLPQSS